MLTAADYLGGIPVVVRLDERDMATTHAQPSPAAFVLPRTTMLLSILPDVLSLFASSCACSLCSYSTQVWFTVEGSTPVDWTFPVGAVKDYVTEWKRIRKRAATAAGDPLRRASLASTGTTATSIPSATAADGGLAGGSVDTDALAPLELVFRVRQPTSVKLMERRVPFFVNYDRLDDFIRNEVRQVHKAAYTAMYGSCKLYQNTPAAALRPAEGLALYRPFHTDAALASLGPGGQGASQVTGLVFSSPHLPTDYQHLLRDALGRRPAAYLLRIGFPFSDAQSASGGAVAFPCHRVPAAPPLLAFSALVQAESSVHGGVEDMSDEVDGREDAVTFGLLLWRLFRIPCLRWLGRHGEEGATDTTAYTPYGELVKWMATRYYTDAPDIATAELSRQDGLRSVGTGGASSGSGGGSSGVESGGGGAPLPPVAWARWEAAMAARLTRDYDEAAPQRGLVLSEAVAALGSAVTGEMAGQRLLFDVQGTVPLLATPAAFLETSLSSSDRTIYVTLRFAGRVS